MLQSMLQGTAGIRSHYVTHVELRMLRSEWDAIFDHLIAADLGGQENVVSESFQERGPDLVRGKGASNTGRAFSITLLGLEATKECSSHTEPSSCLQNACSNRVVYFCYSMLIFRHPA